MKDRSKRRTDFGDALGAHRRLKKWSQQDLARAMDQAGFNTSAQSVSSWESGRNVPDDVDKLRALDKLLGADGELLRILGLGDATPLREVVDDHEARLRRIEEALQLGQPADELSNRRRGRELNGPVRQAADTGNPTPSRTPPKRHNRPSPPIGGDE